MSIECGECERDLRGGHSADCSRHPNNKLVSPKISVGEKAPSKLVTEQTDKALKLMLEVGICGYGEDGGVYSIPASALISRIERLIELVESQLRSTIEEKDREIERWRGHFDVSSASCLSASNKIEQLQARVKELEQQIFSDSDHDIGN